MASRTRTKKAATTDRLLALTEDALSQAAKGRFLDARDFLELASSVCAAQASAPIMLGQQPDTVQELLDMGKDPRFSSSLTLGLTILALFPDRDTILGVAEVADILDGSRSTTHRYLTTLVRMGQLEQAPTGRKYRRARAEA